MKRSRLYLFLYFTATVLLQLAYRSLDRLARGLDSNWEVVLIEQGTGVYGTAVLLPLILWAVRRFPLRLMVRTLVWHTAILISFSVLHTSWNWGTRLMLFPLLGLGAYDYGRMPLRFLMELPADVITYGLAAGIYTIYLNWLRTKNLETELVMARLDSLTRQLQPHFLFNALNAVSSVMYEDLSRADGMLERIGDFLRATMRLPESPFISIGAELELVEQYLAVMETRLEDKLQVEIECDPSAKMAQMPALLLQPLVENAVEHGQDPRSGRLHISIGVRRCAQTVQITIRDRGTGPIHAVAGKGLTNTQRRLDTVYGSAGTFRLSHHPQGGGFVELSIPA